MATALAASGIRPGQLIVAYVTCGIEFHVIARTALELNCPIAPLNPRSTGNEKETKHYFSILKPSVIVVPDEATAERLARSTPAGIRQAKVRLVCNGGPLGEIWEDFCAFAEDSRHRTEAIESLEIERKMDDVVLVIFTSGTTSLRKRGFNPCKGLC